MEDPIIRHFQLMTSVVKYLQTIDADIWVTEYQNPGSFGSWLFIFRLNGDRYRILYDGKERRLVLETESDTPSSSYFPNSWDERAFYEITDKGEDLEAKIQRLIETIPDLS